MPVGSDFTTIYFGEHLGTNEADLSAPWAKFVGNQSSHREFNVGNPPTSAAYMLIQTLNVGVLSHRIYINGIKLDGYQISQHPGWSMWMIVIPEGKLKHGANILQIVRDETSSGSFVVGHVVVHWREVVNFPS